ncbi:IclR family transcriptional regulator [Rhodococcus sp. NPDC056960]|uniref:IclR family transcriptional regulator n=1 Tax=Rhodococcus sp. NPDC056960 TaxID=3345982 RepID=UPI00362A272B
MSEPTVVEPMTAEAGEPAEIANKSVTKAVRLLRELAARPKSGTTVSTLAKAVGISRPTAFRLLYSLERTGLVDRVDNNYTLGWEMARLGRHADPYAGLVARAQPLLQELADTFNETVSLAVPNLQDGLDLIAEAAGSHVVGINSRMSGHMIGTQYPLHASSSGKVLLADWPTSKVVDRLPEHLDGYTAQTITDRTVLLAELDRVRENGFGLIDNELEEELVSLSCPVRDPAGNLVAIVSLNGPRYRFGRERIPDGLHEMQKIVDRLVEVFWRHSAGE